MADIQLAMNMFGLAGLYNDEAMGMVLAAQLAEAGGIDQVVFQDHVCMGERTDRYPFGEFPLPPDAPWLEPMTLMAAVAASTTRIRIASSVVISPLRPATLFAKMAATLDQLSRGRLDLGVGVGWQREEYEAQGLDFDRRWGMFDDQLRACRALWRECPVNFSSPSVELNGIYSTPFPRQAPLPLWFGVAATPRQARRIAELGQGWLPLSHDCAELKRGIELIREAFVAAGRDPGELQVRGVMKPVYQQERPDLQATLGNAQRLIDAGVTALEFVPRYFASSPATLESVIAEVSETICRPRQPGA